jgi:thiol:disulfide interchange protein DsbD
VLKKSTTLWILFIFFVAGIVLAMTPCVLPMIPILSSLILAHKTLSTRKAFLLSMTYVLAMALTYAIAGMIAGLLGNSFQASLQHPVVLILFSLLFVGLAFSMFGFYELQLPSFLRHKLTRWQQHQRGGHYWGVAVMGFISSLLVSPCISAPLAGALAYIGQTGNMFFGGVGLFSLGLGMGLPLIVIGVLGGKLLPRSGPWMGRSKHVAGFLLLGLAIWTLSRLIPVTHTVPGLSLQFVKNPTEVEHILQDTQNKKVLLDFYADWCISCHIIDKKVFADPQVQHALKDYILLRADITANDKVDRELQKKFNVFAPPTIILFDAQGKIVKTFLGEVSTQELLEAIQS